MPFMGALLAVYDEPFSNLTDPVTGSEVQYNSPIVV
jgi:hypothetical protein